MELYDIVEALNDITGNTLVLHRSMRIHPKFKIYKEFYYDLYNIKESDKKLLFTFKEIKNVSSEEIEDTWKECDKLYLRELLKWIKSENNGIQ